MPIPRIVVVGASSGGLEALRALVGTLPEGFAAPVAIVLHTAPESPGLLHDILARAGQLPATNVKTLTKLRAGHIYVAPPDCHLVVEPGRVKATKGPKENRFRPAIDPLFRSAAQVYGPGAIGVILTGNLDDGTAGLWTIKRLGGTAIVQDPADALFPSMPASALNHVAVDYSVPLTAIGPLLIRLTSELSESSQEVVVPDDVNIEVNIAKELHPVDAGLEGIATPSRYACPECHGVLLQMKDAGIVRFRCHTGHAYSMDSLMADVDDGIDEALWNAIRSLEEAALLMNGMVTQLSAASRTGEVCPIISRAQETRRYSDALRKIAAERERWTSKI
jgi:two-component system chemotaxis response regulator CheB